MFIITIIRGQSEMISNTKNNRRDGGFTIVELLIVIVVIGILAAITIVAYNGVQNRANNTKIDTLAKEVVDKAEVYAADHDGQYPTLTQLKAGTASETWALSQGAKDATVASGAAAGQMNVVSCTTATNGFTVTPWDYTKKAVQTTADKDKTPRIRTAGTC